MIKIIQDNNHKYIQPNHPQPYKNNKPGYSVPPPTCTPAQNQACVSPSHTGSYVHLPSLHQSPRGSQVFAVIVPLSVAPL